MEVVVQPIPGGVGFHPMIEDLAAAGRLATRCNELYMRGKLRRQGETVNL